MLRHRIAPAPSPHHHHSAFDRRPQRPEPPPSITSPKESSYPPPSKLPVDFSPPLIAMVVIIATAFVIITYSRLLSRQFLNNYRRYRRWRRHRRRYVPSSSVGDIESQPYSFDHPTDAFHVLSPYGLDEAIIKTIPLSTYMRKSGFHDCAVCLIEFEENDYVRTLPICSHAFHVDCIDIWLRSHANCPLCRAGILLQESPFTPLMAARIRPSLDDMILESTLLEPLTETLIETEAATIEEITQESSPLRSNHQSEDRLNRRDFLLKRSYSLGFERNLGSERLILEPVTASPWRYRRGFWSKRPSPFTSLTKPRVFSFRYYRGMKSPFFRRRGIGGLFPPSESSVRVGSSRRSKSFASPMFMRSSGGTFSPSWQRSGDPEALLSPERLSRR